MLNWGIIGAGGIARVFCNALRYSQTGRAYAVASRTGEQAQNLAYKFAIPKWYAGYQSLLADPEIDVVYISTIHPQHKVWALEAARAGKHILVEKPIGMNHAEAQAMVEAARQHDVFLMEAFMYRCHPQTRKLVELIQEGIIGQVRMIRATMSFQAPSSDPNTRLFSKQLGGGGILDVGCYPASASRLIAGAAEGLPFLEPVEVKGSALLGPTGVDHYAAALLKFENGILAELVCGIDCQLPSQVHVYGSEGMLTVPNLWVPSSPTRNALEPVPLDTPIPPSHILLNYNDQHPPQEVTITPDRDLFTYEADAVAAHISRRQAPAMSWDDSLGNMRLLDRWRAEVGLYYEVDTQ